MRSYLMPKAVARNDITITHNADGVLKTVIT